MRNAFYALLALVFSVAALGLTGNVASAAPQTLPSIQLKDLGNLSPATKVTYRSYCVSRYFYCRNRYGGGWDFRACLRWRGCWDDYSDYRGRHHDSGYSCDHWRYECRRNWGWDNNDYYGCLRYHNCNY